MVRWIFLTLAIVFFLVGLFTVVKAPAWSPWKLAVLAGEFGHWLAPAAAGVALGAWLTRGGGPAVAWVAAGVAVLAVGLLAVPMVQAWRIGRVLPAQLAKEFGAGPPGMRARAFSVGGFFGRDPEPVPMETLEAARGLPLDFYRAVGRRGAAPCVIVVHGGGWDSGDRTQLPGFNHWLARHGYAVAAISYRLAPAHKWPAQRDDVLQAIAFLKERAKALGINPTRLVLLGRSAGGQIAQTVGYTARDPALRGVVGLYAPSDLIFGYVNTHENDMLKSPALMRQYLGGTPDSARDNYESASSLFHVSEASPPTLLLHGTNDALVWYRHSVRLDARLTEVRVPHAYVAMPWATHAFEFNLHGPGGQLTTYALEWFLAAVTR
ncbi:MAG: alpha/beta hydrolase [Verrucomicrobiota bacterium]